MRLTIGRTGEQISRAFGIDNLANSPGDSTGSRPAKTRVRRYWKHASRIKVEYTIECTTERPEQSSGSRPYSRAATCPCDYSYSGL